MAIAFDAETTIGPVNGSPTGTHTPVGTPRGVLVIIVANDGNDSIASVTYGGTAMTEITDSPVLNTLGDENGSVHGFFLGASVPTGAQTVTATAQGANVNKIMTVWTVTAAADTEVDATEALTSASVDDPSMTLATTASTTTFVAGGIHSGLATLVSVTVGADYTQVTTRDYGSQVAKTQRRTSNASGGNVTFNWTTSAADDVAMLAAAIREVEAGQTATANTATETDSSIALTRIKTKSSKAPPLRGITPYISDDFDRTDSTGLGNSSEGWDWEAPGSAAEHNIVSNRARTVGLGGGTRSRAAIDLPSSDHYVEALVSTSDIANYSEMGVTARGSGTTSTETHYWAVWRGSIQLWRMVNGSLTQIGGNVTQSVSVDTQYRLRLEVEGSQQRVYWEGSLVKTENDTNITTGVRTGIHGQKNTTGHCEWDDFISGNLASELANPLTRNKTKLIGIAAETDTAQTIEQATPAVNTATETDTAIALTRNKAKALGIAGPVAGGFSSGFDSGFEVGGPSESAGTFGRVKSRVVGIASETDTSQEITTPGGIEEPIQTALETDSAIAIGRLKTKLIGIASETDSSQAISRLKSKAVGIASETDTSIAISRNTVKLIQTALETNSAQALGRLKAKLIWAPTSGWGASWGEPWGGGDSDFSGPIGKQKSKAIGIASETDTAEPVTIPTATPISIALETDTAQALGRNKAKLIGIATEADTSIPLTRLKAKALGIAGGGVAPITDDFNRSGADAMGSSSEGWSWTETFGDIDIHTNNTTVVNGGNSANGNLARADIDLGSPDHYAEITTVEVRTGLGPGFGLAVRCDPTSQACYFIDRRGNGALVINRRTSGGSNTALLTRAAGFHPNLVNGDVIRLEVEGDDLRVYLNGSLEDSVTDTNSSLDLFERAGIYLRHSATGASGVWADDFTAGALALPSETAIAFGRAKSRLIGISSETDTSRPITTPGEMAEMVDTALETDTAISITRHKSRSVGTASEADSSQAVGRSKSKLIGIASETDSSQAIPEFRSRLIGIASETDSSQAVGRLKTKLIGIAAETDSAQSLGRNKARLVGLASETDSSQAIGQATSVGTASETDSSQAIGRLKTKLIGIAAETDAAISVDEDPIRRLLGIATETDTAQSIGILFAGTINPAFETDSAQAIGRFKSKTISASTEADSAQAIGRSRSRLIGIASETSSAQSIGRLKTRSVSTALETDTAIAITRRSSKAVSSALETDTAQAVGRRKSRLLGTASSTETSGTITPPPEQVEDANPALETDTARPVGKSKSKLIGIASETDSSQSLTRRKSKTIQAATESSFGILIGKTKQKTIGISNETDTSRPIVTPQFLAIGTALEMDSAGTIAGVQRFPDYELIGSHQPVIRLRGSHGAAIGLRGSHATLVRP